MCGIVAIINTTNTNSALFNQIQQMNEMLHHRGPDGTGLWNSDCKKVYLGHKRLSIIDLSNAANQPMMSFDKQYIIVFNGEIYNYKELKDDCIKMGSKFSTVSDTEVLIEAYRHWGDDCFLKLRGMWAIILFDIKQNKVIISRDPFAIKPLYYGFFHGHFYFASEPKALTILSDHFKEEDKISSQLFLDYGYLERDEWTFYKNIKRFPHAHFAVINLNQNHTQLNLTRYWKPKSTINYSLSFKQAAKKLRELFIDSLQLHLRSDVPVGACLSGGIDSSAIVCMGTRLLNSDKFTTFTSQYPLYQHIDETKWAQEVINHTQAKAYFTEPTKTLFKNSLQDLLWTQDEPFGSMSIFAQYCVFKKIKETTVKVVLDGQGADEMLAGYIGYIPVYFDELAKNGKFISLTRELLAFKDMNIQFDAKNKIISAIKNSIKWNNKYCHNKKIDNFYKDEMASRLYKISDNFNSFEEQLENLLCESNIPQLLRYEDRNSMRFSIESRVPFLNMELVEFVLSLPANFRVRNGYTKAVLREALKGVIPEQVRNRVDKLGFPAPDVQWMNECFGINVQTSGGREWREFIYKRWGEMKNKTAVSCFDFS
ncbi:asparagine synthase (glutamine-hydrolyzing) [Legionella spiritensis]|uniref:asparagine synthase (glutamine-hydrolyzing) n=1 Tax=Legionella spiritensis TaxID=452 RepID=UPI000F716510|nr:asparagine synthase (glutamine-hydrolyzing) [Legionella spiritensis]VEG89673.1 asparagine synthetase, glutamine-hydrolyzing [Legionella spiritensis]